MKQRRTGSLLISSLFFTILQPGLVSGLFPYLILGSRVKEILQNDFTLPQYFGSIIFFAGLIIMLECIVRFALEGRGTLSPADPTQILVVKGLYRYSRNPMYLGVVSMLIGEAVFFEAGRFWYYVVGIALAFNLFILLVEEPRLKRDFGAEYEEYCRKVRRWL
jgi:protein-S-isoprenylcysteine O-methyltransferase Ste14